MFISVDLPDPDGPMMATNSPRVDVSETPAQRAHSVSRPSCIDLRDVFDVNQFGLVVSLRIPGTPPPPQPAADRITQSDDHVRCRATGRVTSTGPRVVTIAQ